MWVEHYLRIASNPRRRFDSGDPGGAATRNSATPILPVEGVLEVETGQSGDKGPAAALWGEQSYSPHSTGRRAACASQGKSGVRAGRSGEGVKMGSSP